jgi:hypothetical protein
MQMYGDRDMLTSNGMNPGNEVFTTDHDLNNSIMKKKKTDQLKDMLRNTKYTGISANISPR